VVKATKEGTREPWKLFYPLPFSKIPPSIELQEYKECMPEVVLWTIAEKLQRRGVLKGKGGSR